MSILRKVTASFGHALGLILGEGFRSPLEQVKRNYPNSYYDIC
ncbi:hypothetical protein ACFLTB_07740 [Chloroflexota bacterium]